MKSTKNQTVEEAVKAVTTPMTQSIEVFLVDGGFREFHDIAGYRVGDGFVAVLGKESDTTVFPVAVVKEVRHFNVPVVQ